MIVPGAPTPPEVASGYRAAGWWDDSGLREGLEAIAERDGDRLAVVDNEGSWSYGQLRETVERAVYALLAAGVEPGDAVLLITPNSFMGVAATLAVLRSSAVAVTLDRRCGPSDVAHAVAMTDPRLLVLPGDLVTPLKVARHGRPVASFEALRAATGSTGTWEEPDKSAPRIVLFTSGTTSKPKAVIHSLHSLLCGARNLATTCGFTSDDAPFLSSPLSSITGFSHLLMALSGGWIVLEDKFDAVTSLDHLAKGGATVLGGAPIIAETLLGECARRNRSTTLRTIVLGGAMIPRPLLQMAIDRFSIRPVRAYGSSEAPTHTASRRDDPLSECIANDGAPLPGAEIEIGSANDESELRVRGPNLFLGYLEPADNQRAFSAGWFCTGDTADIEAGRLVIRGRLKELVVRKGLKISLQEIDDAVIGLPSAIECAAYGVADSETGERLVLAVRAAPPHGVTYESVSRFLLDGGLARWKLPEQVVTWEEPLPRTASGKIIRNRLASDGSSLPTEFALRLRPTD
ncbi:MAG: class I adenylate-forming enzyme family protein [Acidimicrobiales bacterium]